MDNEQNECVFGHIHRRKADMDAPVWGNTKNAFKKQFFFFGRNSNIHGFRLLMQEKLSPLLRLFWLLVLIASGGSMYLLLRSVVQQNAHISFTPDTVYAEWTTVFPAVTVCERYNSFSYRSAMKKFSDLYPQLLGPLDFKFKRHLTDILYSEGRCIGPLCEDCGINIPCDLAWRNISTRIRKKCEEIIANCTYNEESFRCCQYFRPIDSEKGPCFVINSLQYNTLFGNETLVVNRKTGPGVLSFNISYPADLSIHSSEELSTKYLDPKYLFSVSPEEVKKVELLFSIVEMHNELSLYYESIEHRKCRFPHEIPESSIHSYKVYSYGVCKLAEETRDKLDSCGCVHPVRDLSYEKEYCNYTGITCLMKYDKQNHDLVGKNHVDPCLPSCIESEINVIYMHTDSIDEAEDAVKIATKAQVNIRMASLPSLRYVRQLLRTDLDLVVSIGGIVGLFFGASVLSLAETIYLILRRTK